jgi:hypothetical protein
LVRKSKRPNPRWRAKRPSWMILDEWQSWSSKGTFLQSPPMSHQKIGPVDPGVGQNIDGNRIQDGHHIVWTTELIIERNLPPLVTHNKPQKNRINQPRHLSSNRRKVLLNKSVFFCKTIGVLARNFFCKSNR